MTIARGAVIAGPVASFTDANTSTTASQFVAQINWGDGRFSVATVSGGAGTFVVDASHEYAKNGRYAISVTVNMTGPISAGATGSGTAVVVNPSKLHPRARFVHRIAKKPAKPAKRGHN
jgi:PKD repeat protein